MENKIVFGRWEAITVLINSICMQVFLNYPRNMVESAGTAGWILSLYSSLLAFVFFIIISKLYSHFEGKDILDIAELVGCKAVRTITGLIVLVHILVAISLILREFTEDMKVIALTTSPISFVTIFFVIGMIMAAYIGLEAIVRFHGIIVPIIATGYLIIIFGALTHFEFSNITPVFGSGFKEIFIKGSMKISTYSALLILYLIAPYIKNHKNFKSVGYTAIGFSTFFLMLSTFIYIGVQSYAGALESFLPIYQLARIINVGRFLQRVESIFVLIWAAAALLYLSIVFYLFLHIFKKTFELEYYKPLIIPFAILIFNFSLLPQNLLVTIKFETDYFRNYAWIATFAIPLILLLIAMFLKRNNRYKAKKECNNG